jgi:hypothetical protein
MISTRTNGRFARAAAIFAAAALVAGASVPASATANDPSPKSSEAKPAKEKRYCVEQVTTGTMLRQAKICKTREEWIAQTGTDPVRK